MSDIKLSDSEILIRPAKREDMAAVVDMIKELADFEKMPEGPKLTVEDLQRDGFDSAPPLFECAVAAAREAAVGYALYYRSYSTWGGRALVLEDLYVRPGARGRGAGRGLLARVAQHACQWGACRVDFHVLQWNPARAFYSRLGAVDLTESEQWGCYRLAGTALAELAALAARGDTQHAS